MVSLLHNAWSRVEPSLVSHLWCAPHTFTLTLTFAPRSCNQFHFLFRVLCFSCRLQNCCKFHGKRNEQVGWPFRDRLKTSRFRFQNQARFGTKCRVKLASLLTFNQLSTEIKWLTKIVIPCTSGLANILLDTYISVDLYSGHECFLLDDDHDEAPVPSHWHLPQQPATPWP